MRRSRDPSQPLHPSDGPVHQQVGDGLVFGAAADAYERGRPSYPSAAAQWLAPESALRVLDLGAGTGKFTRQLVSPGRTIVAVDPDHTMLHGLRRNVPGIATSVGTAEQIPLADGCVDVVTVAQAWHWVDLDRAVPEVARVLRPGGTLGLIWNVRDDSQEWMAELDTIIHRGQSQELNESDPTVGPPFAPLESIVVPWVHTMTSEQFIDMVASRSYIIAMSDGERAKVLDDALAHVLSEPGQTAETISIPYLTHAYRAALP